MDDPRTTPPTTPLEPSASPPTKPLESSPATPTIPLESSQPPRRRWLLWAAGCLGMLLLCQVAAVGVLLAFPSLRAQIPAFWVRPSAAAPPESPLHTDQPAPTRPLIFEDTFDQPTTRWDQSLARVVDGVYEVRVDIPNNDTYGLLLIEGAVYNFDMAVDVRQAAGDPTAEYGIRFRQIGPDDYLMFSISGSGYYRLLRVQNNTYRSLVPWTFDGRIKTGAGAVNRMRVVAEGESISASVNGIELLTASDEVDVGGQLTLGVTTFDTGGLAVRFDNVEGQAEGTDLKEDFSNSESALWSVGGATIESQAYEIFAGPGLKSWQQPLPSGFSEVGDFVLEVDATLVRGPDEGAVYGVMFGDGGKFDFYTLYLFPQGGIGLFRSEAGSGDMPLVRPVPLEIIKQGTGATNHIRLEVHGNTISITLNGTRLPDLENPDPIRGMVGLIVGGETQARFDNFRLEEL
jgi:hypothetical protein